MATVRLNTREVQVDDTVYVFDIVQVADKFEACVAAADAAHCEVDFPPVEKRPGLNNGPSGSPRENQ
jgi:hypothetical protein